MAKTAPARRPDAAQAARLFEERCGSCHGSKGKGGSAKRLSGTGLTDDQFISAVRERTSGNHGFKAKNPALVRAVREWLASDPSPDKPPAAANKKPALKHETHFRTNAYFAAKRPLSRDPFSLQGGIRLAVDHTFLTETKGDDSIIAEKARIGALVDGRFFGYPDSRGGFAFWPGEAYLYLAAERLRLIAGLFTDNWNFKIAPAVAGSMTYGTDWLSGTVRGGVRLLETRQGGVPTQGFGDAFYSIAAQGALWKRFQAGMTFEHDFSTADGHTVDKSLRTYFNGELFDLGKLNLLAGYATCSFSFDIGRRYCAAGLHLEGKGWGLDFDYEDQKGPHLFIPDLDGESHGTRASAVWHMADSMSAGASVAANDANIVAHLNYFARRKFFSGAIRADYVHRWTGSDAFRLGADIGLNVKQIPGFDSVYLGPSASYIFERDGDRGGIFKLAQGNSPSVSLLAAIAPKKSPVILSGSFAWSRGQAGDDRDRYAFQLALDGGFGVGAKDGRRVHPRVVPPTWVGRQARIAPARIEPKARDIHTDAHLTQEEKIKEEQSCGLCHAPMDDRRLIRVEDSMLRDKERCAGCHDSAEAQADKKATLAQYSNNRQHPFQLPDDWALSRCDRCHEAEDGKKTRIRGHLSVNDPNWGRNHGRVAEGANASTKIGQGMDPARNCGTCHDGDRGAVVASAKAPEIELTPPGCGGCHTPSAYSPNMTRTPHAPDYAGRNHAFDGQANPRSCGSCHAGSSEADKLGLCRDCHSDEFIASPHVDGFVEMHPDTARSFNGDLCGACHTPPAPPSRGQQQADRAICGACHRPGR